MRFIISILLLAFSLSSCTDGKKVAESSTKQEAAEEIELPPPTTLEEAHELLERLPPEELAKIDAMKSEDEMIEYHFGLGMGLRNSWGLWKGGLLAKHMHELGFFHADDMSGVILDTFWCKRHNKEFRLKERAAYYEAYWRAAKQPDEKAKDPRDGSAVEWNRSIGAGDGKTPRRIHMGTSVTTGRWLAYEYDKGVYIPDEELLKRIKEAFPED